MFNLNDNTKDFESATIDDFGVTNMLKIKNKPHLDGKMMFAGVLATDFVYNLHFGQGIDWDHFMLWPSYISELTDKTTILRFNYTENREVYDVF